MDGQSTYHKILRVSSVVCALILIFDSGLIHKSTSLISENAQEYVSASVGMSASVQPTELNQLTAALTAKEQELAAREAALNEREIGVNISSPSTDSDASTYIIASILFVLLVLILLNYALDYLRMKEEKESITV